MMWSLGIEPFPDFLVSCLLNNLFSIVVAAEPSYRKAVYLNDYHYQQNDWTNPSNEESYIRLNARTLEIDNRADMLRPAIGDLQRCSFVQDEAFEEEIQSLLKNGTVVMPRVDLFYWLPDSLCWQKRHWYHYSLITGYDDLLQLYQVFDYHESHYKLCLIPAERFRVAVRSAFAPSTPQYLTLILASPIPPFTLTLDEVRTNAARLVDDLTRFETSDLWTIDRTAPYSDEVLEASVSALGQIVDRQLANRCLFEALAAQGSIGNDLCPYLASDAQRLERGWQIVGNILQKLSLTQQALEVGEVQSRASSLMNLERGMWEKLLSAPR